MSNLVSLEKAAQLLGITPDELNEMRLQNEVFGSRDGANWKFRMDEIQRLADDKGITLADDNQGADFELSEGGNDFEVNEVDSDFELSDSAELGISDSEELLLSSSGDFDGGKEEDFEISDELSLAPEEDLDVLADDEPAQTANPSDTGKIIVDGDLELSEDDLFDDSKDEVGLLDSSEISSDFDSDLVLESSSEDAELEVEPEMTLQLDDGSNDDFSLDSDAGMDDLELPEDSDLFALDDSEIADSETLLKSDDDFNLTPFEDAADDSSSGSQVIALEDSAIYTDDSVPTEFAAEPDEVGALELDPDTMIAPAEVEAVAAGIPAADEVPYTLLNVLALAATLAFVAVGGMLAFDLARNMWQPEGMTLDGGVANFFIDLAGYTDN